MTHAAVDKLLSVSAAPNAHQGRRPSQMWLQSMDRDGKLIELARLNVRLCTRESMTHVAWADLLNLPVEVYKSTLFRDDQVRRALVDVARSALTTSLSGLEFLQTIRVSLEYRRLGRAYRAEKQSQPVRNGRPTVPAFTSGTLGKRLEQERCDVGIGTQKWAEWLGVSDRTYRKYLEEEVHSDRAAAAMRDWVRDADKVVERMRFEVLKKLTQRPPVTEKEVNDAYELVYRNMVAMRKVLVEEAAESFFEIPDAPKPSNNIGDVDLATSPDEEDR